MLIASKNIAKDATVATKRIQRFIEEVPQERLNVSRFMNDLRKLGEVYIFGGLIRDISLFGVPNFSSDIDLIIEPNDSNDLEQFLHLYDAQKNKFGGFRLTNGRWKFDVWEMKKTWAFEGGHIKYSNKFTLFDTTFFNWDAVFYSVNESKLYSTPDYFRELSKLNLEINLEQNPNELGSFVRSLRLILMEGVSTGSTLTQYIISQLEYYTDEQIREYEASSFSSSRLTDDLLICIRERSLYWDEYGSFKWFKPAQLCLFDLVDAP